MRTSLSHARFVPLVTLVALAACTKTDGAPATQSAAPATATASSAATMAPTLVTVVATDYSYDAPDTVTAGMVTLRLINNGPEIHHIQLIRLNDGKTFGDLAAALKALKPGAPLPTFVEELAAPNVPAGAEGQEVTQELTAGNYVLACMIPSPDGIPHFAKGMMRPLTVVASTGPTASVPMADVRVTMTDYSWEITPVLTAGKHTIRLENSATQPHEMLIVKLNPGATANDFVMWAEKMQGPPPGSPAGGTSGMVKGAVAYVPVNLTPGEYAMICFIPDAKDGKPHSAHGMVKSFSVS